MPLKVTPADTSLDGAHLPFDEQIAFFQAKLGNLIPTRTWRDVRHAGHDTGFMVAGAAKADLLSDFAQAVDSTIAEGKSLQWFRQAFDAIVEEHGWSHTGGRDWRSKVIYQTNMATSYAAGRLAQLRDPELQKLAPFWMYVHNDSVLHPRPQHLAWNGLTLPADDPWFKTHYPPNGWGCRCRVTAVSKAQATRDGGRFGPPPDDGANPKTGTPNGIDRGFDYMPGDTVTERIRQTLLDQKLPKLEAPLGVALWESLAPAAEDLAAEFASWANTIKTSGKTTGSYKAVDAIDAALLEKMSARNVAPATAEVVVRDADVLHAFRAGKADALPWDWYLNLPANLPARKAVILDTTEPGKPALLYVFDLPGNATGKLVLKLDYEVTVKGAGGIKRKKRLNVLRTGKFVDPEGMKQPGYDVLEGRL